MLSAQPANNVTGEYFRGMIVQNALVASKRLCLFPMRNRLFVQTVLIAFSNTTQIATLATIVLSVLARTQGKIRRDLKDTLCYQVDLAS